MCYYTNIDCSWGKWFKIAFPRLLETVGVRSREMLPPRSQVTEGKLTISRIKSSKYIFVLYNAYKYYWRKQTRPSYLLKCSLLTMLTLKELKASCINKACKKKLSSRVIFSVLAVFSTNHIFEQILHWGMHRPQVESQNIPYLLTIESTNKQLTNVLLPKMWNVYPCLLTKQTTIDHQINSHGIKGQTTYDIKKTSLKRGSMERHYSKRKTLDVFLKKSPKVSEPSEVRSHTPQGKNLP